MELKPKPVELPSHNSKLHQDNRRLMSVNANKVVLNPTYDAQSNHKTVEQKALQKRTVQKNQNRKSLTVLGSPVENDSDVFVFNAFLCVFLIMMAAPILGLAMLLMSVLVVYTNSFFVIIYVMGAVYLLSKYVRLLARSCVKCYRLGRQFVKNGVDSFFEKQTDLTYRADLRQKNHQTFLSNNLQNYFTNLSPAKAKAYVQNTLVIRFIAIFMISIQCIVSFFGGDFILVSIDLIILFFIWNVSKEVLNHLNCIANDERGITHRGQKDDFERRIFITC